MKLTWHRIVWRRSLSPCMLCLLLVSSATIVTVWQLLLLFSGGEVKNAPKVQSHEYRFRSGSILVNNAVSSWPSDLKSNLEVTIDCAATKDTRTLRTGWNLCLLGPFLPQAPCTVLSFGVNVNSWDLEISLASEFECRVFVFDPYISPLYLAKNENPSYLREGLLGSGLIREPWFSESYLGHLKRLKLESMFIDVLKLESNELAWHAVEVALKDGSLTKVKQLLISVPISQQSSQHYRVLSSLHAAGFRLWSHKPDKGRGHQLHFINSMFLLTSEPVRNPVEADKKESLNRLPIVKLHGFKSLSEIRKTDLESLSVRQLEDLYYGMIQITHVHCPNIRRVGDTEDGGWDVCFSGPFDIRKRRQCVAFSFGINYIYDYDDNLADQYKCKVYMFDPSMKGTDYQRRPTSWFYKTGLSSNNTVAPNGWKMRTLCTLFKELGYEGLEIDILKIDVEFWEWVSFEKALEEGCLNQVRQLLFETHTAALMHQNSDYANYIRILTKIYNVGFVTWYTHYTHSVFFNFTGVSKPCCHEHYLINQMLIHL